MANQKIIEFKDVVVKFRVRSRMLTAIRRVSLDVYKGETLAIVGESGSGKSVLTKTLSGMLESNGFIDSGEVLFHNFDKDGNEISVENLVERKTNKDWYGFRGKKVATVFQDPMTSLNPLISIGEQIAEVIRLHKGLGKEEARLEAIELLRKVGIKDPEKRYKDYPYQYSGGMRQRVVIAIALACAPEVLLCDEPTTALDVTIQAQILELIKELSQEYGFTVIFITHDLGVVANVADRVAVLYAGQVIEVGTADEIFYDPKHPYTWALLSSLPQLGMEGEDLYAIDGTPPSLFHEIKGDSFAPRNPFALEIDFVKEPPMFKVSETHYAKTWLLDPRSPKVNPPKAISNLHEKVLALRGVK